MKFDQFRTMLTLDEDTEGRTVLPVSDPSVERIFGGQIMAQLIAAVAPPGSPKVVKSLQIAFPAPDAPPSRCTWIWKRPTTGAPWASARRGLAGRRVCPPRDRDRVDPRGPRR